MILIDEVVAQGLKMTVGCSSSPSIHHHEVVLDAAGPLRCGADPGLSGG